MAKTTPKPAAAKKPAPKKRPAKATKRKQPAKDRTTAMKKKAMLEALRASLGIITKAIDALNAKGISMDRKTHYNWMNNDPEYAADVEEMADIALDFAEGKLFERINGVPVLDRKGKQETDVDGLPVYYVPPSDTAIIWYTKTKGKSRGYIERQEITGKDGEPLPQQVVKFKLPDGTEIDI